MTDEHINTATESAVALWRQMYGESHALTHIWTAFRNKGGKIDERTIISNNFNYPAAIESAEAWALEKSAEGREVYFSANLLKIGSKSREKENAAEINTLYADLDGTALPNDNLTPSFVWETSPRRLQCGWRLTEPVSPEKAEWLNKRLTYAIGADKSGWDLNQLLRPPGTVNHKYENHPTVRILKLDSELTYTPEELDQILPAFAELEEKDSTEREEAASPEPPVELSPEALKVWRGEKPTLKENGSGEVDRSKTLLNIGRATFDAGANERVVVDALRERDKTLGYHKYTGNRDGGQKEYERIYKKLKAKGRNRTHNFDTSGRQNGSRGVASSNNTCRDRIITASELLGKRFPPTRYVVPDILPEGVSLLAGKPKQGKSWAAYHLAIAVAAGGVAFGKHQVEQGNALYLALEDGERRLQKRLKKLVPEGDAPEDLDLVTEWSRLDNGGVEEIGEWLEESPNPRLIVIDTLKKVRPQAKGKNVYAEDYEALEPLLPLAQDHRVGMLVVHHLRQMDAEDPLDTISGSTGLTGGVDGALVLKRERGRADAFLYVTHRDLEEDKEIALNWSSETALWTDKGDASEYRLSQERAAVLNVLDGVGGGLGPKDIHEALEEEGCKTTYNAVRRLLPKMARDGQLKNPRQGVYTLPEEEEDSWVF